MASWNEPKSDYVASDQVLPSIFNELAENEKYLKEMSCQVVTRTKEGTDSQVVSLVFLEDG